ncbi:MAG: hypothetical protein L0H53_04675 [Candidatus Nitrosocosmicus sp.]|nr:hypothetical protein [Candidatus Nitrosocosmicus sp.]MDN5867329.1 hypothetical protein [Candidatus Nitrosocosmicus sp.]
MKNIITSEETEKELCFFVNQEKVSCEKYWEFGTRYVNPPNTFFVPDLENYTNPVRGVGEIL